MSTKPEPDVVNVPKRGLDEHFYIVEVDNITEWIRFILEQLKERDQKIVFGSRSFVVQHGSIVGRAMRIGKLLALFNGQ